MDEYQPGRQQQEDSEREYERMVEQAEFVRDVERGEALVRKWDDFCERGFNEIFGVKK